MFVPGSLTKGSFPYFVPFFVARLGPIAMQMPLPNSDTITITGQAAEAQKMNYPDFFPLLQRNLETFSSKTP